MFEFIKGTLIEKTPIKAIVEAAGIGYRLSIPLNTYTRLPAPKSPVELYLSHIVREDSEALYAFATQEERDLFETLLTISGIGPKTGIAIIGHIDISSFQRAIAASDTRLLSKIPGIGKKTAERLVIEMRDKFKTYAKKEKGAAVTFGAGDILLSDALNALINLGYGPIDAQKAIAAVLEEKKDETDLGRLITAALQKI
ncbi:MAG: Holliday junction branch migration protein RuvA [Verrucomicrobiota bacterium]|nr:Holliday junction branch migration protein RuvA [Verrucomicrobiota bacterium]